MNDSEPDPCFQSRRSRLRLPSLISIAGLLLVLGACAEEPLPQRNLGVDDCLTNVRLDQLDEAIQRCNKVVAAFPAQPQPLNERFLLHWLKGDETAACSDIRKADTLARRLPPARLDRQLRRDLELRLASCSEPPGPKATVQRPAAAPSPASTSPPR